MFFKFLIVILFSYFLTGLSYLIVGFSCFYLGKFLKFVWLKRFGHLLVAMGDASNFGAHKNWLSRNCLGGCCSKCRLWTCSGKKDV